MNTQDRAGSTPLYDVSIRGHLDVVQKLTSSSNINVRNDERRTPLRYASRHEKLNAVQLLLRGITRTQYHASIRPSLDVPRQVITFGAYINARDIYSVYLNTEDPMFRVGCRREHLRRLAHVAWRREPDIARSRDHS